MSQPIRSARRFASLLILCLGLFSTQSSAKPRLSPETGKAGSSSGAIDFSELDQLVPEELKETKTPGAVITVVSGDQVVYQKAFGVANVETNAPLQPEMLFRLGSTTKMFTAAALLTLVEQNKIKLNEPIGERVKQLNPKLGKLTPHYLLSNSAGLRDFAAPVTSNDEAALGNMVRSWKEDVFFAEQGEIYSYSSAGFWLSGFVIEELHGKPYADAMSDLLFKPLGMDRTTLRPFLAITYPFATGHALDAGKPAIIRPMFNNTAIVLTNKSGETMRKSLNKAMELGLGVKDDEQKPSPLAPPTSSEMNEYAGIYSHAPTTWDVFVRDGKLYVRVEDKEHLLTKSGDRKFTYGEQNENEIVFVLGKSGKIDFIFTELYGAKRVAPGQ